MCHTKHHDFWGSWKTSRQANRCKTTSKLPTSPLTDCKASCSLSDRGDGDSFSAFPHQVAGSPLPCSPSISAGSLGSLCAGQAHSLHLVPGARGQAVWPHSPAPFWAAGIEAIFRTLIYMGMFDSWRLVPELLTRTLVWVSDQQQVWRTKSHAPLAWLSPFPAFVLAWGCLIHHMQLPHRKFQ